MSGLPQISVGVYRAVACSRRGQGLSWLSIGVVAQSIPEACNAASTQKMASSDAHETVNAAQLWGYCSLPSLWHSFWQYLWLHLWHDLWLYLWLYLGSVHRVCPLLFCLFHTSAFYHFIRVQTCMLWHVDMSLRHIVLSGPSVTIVACVCGCGSAWCRAGASGVKKRPVVSNRKHPATPPTGGSVEGSVVPVVVSGYRCSCWCWCLCGAGVSGMRIPEHVLEIKYRHPVYSVCTL